MDSWTEKETAGSRIRDKRLQSRLKKLLERLSKDPEESIPAAMEGWSETLAAYRFLDNDKVDYEGILEGHRQATEQRISKEAVVLLVQDTTFLTYGTDKEIGLGTIHETQSDWYLLHPTVALTPGQVNLGILGANFWQRPEKSIRHLRASKPIEEKESYRWLTGYQRACQVQARCPDTLVISVADREGDIYEWLVDAQNRPLEEKAESIIRAKSNRRVDTESSETQYLWETMSRSPMMGELNLVIPRTKQRKARAVRLMLRAKSVELISRKGPPVSVNAVYAKEARPPRGDKAIEWMLLTSLAVDELAMAQSIVGWYRCRWEIEVYFRILKHGCTIEDLRLENDRRLSNCIAIYLIVAWRIHTITMTSRSYPDKNCQLIFTEKEWKTIYLMHKKKKPPKKPPKLNEITRMLAQLGGFLATKNDGEPGAKTVWRGYRRLKEYVCAIELAHHVLLS